MSQMLTAKTETAEAVYLGYATSVNGEDLHVCRKPDGGAVVYGSRRTVLEFDFGPLADYRELLDRAAMPGQPLAAAGTEG